MVLDVGGYLRGTGSDDDGNISEEAVRTYHACLEARNGIAQAMREGGIPMEAFREYDERLAAVEVALSGLWYPPGPDA